MRVLAKVITAAGTPAVGRKVSWWVPTKTGTFESWDSSLTREDGTVDMDVSRASFGSHLRLDGAMVAAYPARFNTSVYDLGVLVLLEPARQGVRAVAAGAFVTGQPVPPESPQSPGGVDLRARLLATGVQIQTTREQLSTVSLTQVRVKWTETTATGALEAEAQFEQPPARAVEPVPPPPAPVERPAPDLRGLTPAAARRTAAARGLRLEVTPLFVPEPERHGRVLRQVPEPGTNMTTLTLRLYVGRAPET